MIYILLVCLIVFFAISYLFSGRDFFAPATVQILTFVASVFLCIYFMLSLDCPYDFHWGTIGIIMAAMALSAILGIGTHQLISKVEIKEHSPEKVDISPISNVVSLLTVCMEFVTIAWLLHEIYRIGGSAGGFFATMNRFRALYSYSTEESGRLPWLLEQLINLVNVLFILYGFNIIRFFDDLTRRQRFVNYLIMGLCCLTTLLTGMRGNLIKDIVCLVVMFHLLRIQKQGKYKKYSLKFFVRVNLIVVLIMSVFFLAKSFVGRAGRNNTLNVAEYISYYAGSGFIALDKYFQRPPMPSNIFGKETFYKLIHFLTSYGIVDLPPYIIHKEFRPVGAGFTNNVYTFLRIYHYDFGIVGMYILHSLSIVLMSVFYEYVKKKRGNIGILIYGQMYYTVVLSFFTEYFYDNVISMYFVKNLVELLVLYELLIRKRIRLKFRRTAHVLHPIPIQQESHTIDS